MKRLLATLLLVAALLGAGGAARADSGSAGAQPFSFLQLDSSARAAALGGAYTALATDANALQYNPAGLGFVKENEASLMYNEFFQSATQEHGEAALTSGFGASYDMLNYGTLTRTTYSTPDGSLGTFSIVDTALDFGYGRAFGPFALGGAAKWVRESNAGTIGQGWATDLGALWLPTDLPGLRLGAAAQNLGEKVRFQSDNETLPTTGRFGAGYAFRAFGEQNLVTADSIKAGTDKVRYSFGAETIAGGSLALRVGYTTRNQTGLGLSAGFGWRGRQWSIDYALAPYGDLGLTNRVSVGLRWGGRPAAGEGVDPIVAEALRGRAQNGPAAGEGQVVPTWTAEVGAGDAAAPRRALTPAERIERAGLMIDTERYDDADLELGVVDRLLADEDPLRVDWHEARGRVRRARRDYDAARAEFTAALGLAQQLGLSSQVVADAYEGMGRTLADQGLYDYAVKFLRKADALRPRLELKDLIELYQKRVPK